MPKLRCQRHDKNGSTIMNTLETKRLSASTKKYRRRLPNEVFRPEKYSNCNKKKLTNGLKGRMEGTQERYNNRNYII